MIYPDPDIAVQALRAERAGLRSVPLRRMETHPADDPAAEKEPVAGEFRRIDESCYQLRIPALGIEFTVDRLRRKWDELTGELSVRCAMPGAQTFDGVLSVADLNLSNLKARTERATYLAGRSRTDDLDWTGLLERFVQQVLSAERQGEPSILLRDVPRPKADEFHDVAGLHLLKQHPTVAFGDGGAAKSLLALYCAGMLDRAGVRVGLFDWELAAEDHRDRLERLFGPDMPAVRYTRCTRPLFHEADRLRRIVRDDGLDYAILDSVAFACDGPPEAAEVAGRYFQALRRLGVGTLNIAHISKAEGADQKPFGSAFWHNGARSTWFVKLAETTPDSAQINIGLFNRKANLGALRPPVGFEITFGEQVLFRRTDVADSPELSAHLSVRQRMYSVLRRGSMTPEELAPEVTASIDTVKRTARRYKDLFVLLPGGAMGLKGRSQ